MIRLGLAYAVSERYDSEGDSGRGKVRQEKKETRGSVKSCRRACIVAAVTNTTDRTKSLNCCQPYLYSTLVLVGISDVRGVCEGIGATQGPGLLLGLERLPSLRAASVGLFHCDTQNAARPQAGGSTATVTNPVDLAQPGAVLPHGSSKSRTSFQKLSIGLALALILVVASVWVWEKWRTRRSALRDSPRITTSNLWFNSSRAGSNLLPAFNRQLVDVFNSYGAEAASKL